MEKPWRASVSQFLNATGSSYEKALAISQHTHDTLAASPEVADLYDHYSPMHDAYIASYGKLCMYRDETAKSTRVLNSLQKELAEVAYDWEYEILGLYRKDTPGYICLMWKGRKPFYSDTTVMRISALGAFSLSLAREPQLATLKSKVDAFHTALQDAYSRQIQNKVGIKIYLHELGRARKALCNGLMYVKYGLDCKFYANKEKINHFFRLDLIRNVSKNEKEEDKISEKVVTEPVDEKMGIAG